MPRTTIGRTGPAIALAAVFVIVLALSQAAPAHASWSLVWSDEFDGTALDTGDWNYDVGTGCPNLCGWGNNELQYYRTQNVAVTGGNLVITARDESYGGASFTSGKVHTRGKRSFLYGRFEMRAKLPTGGGMWPAFWMMPQDDAYGGWASSGEIDIMESANATTSVGGALHFGGQWPENTSTGGSTTLGGASFADDFHVYAVEWEPDQIRWYVDGVLFMTRTSAQWYSDGAPGNPRAPFDQPFYLILNTAVGGWYTGCTEPGCVTADLPQQYVIDYVRVYQDIANFPPTVAITSPAPAAQLPAGDIALAADAADSDGTIDRVEFYAGATLLFADTTAPYATTWTGVPDGCYTLSARAIDDLGGEATATVDVTVGAGCGQAPYAGTAPVLPARLQAEDYDTGGPGVAYHDSDPANTGGQYRPAEGVDIEACSDAGGGWNVGWIEPGEWLEYTVDVPAAGGYTVLARVSSVLGGARFRVEAGGVDVTGEVTVPRTGSWQLWTTVSATASLPAGTQVLRFVPTTAGFNFNWLEFQAGAAAVLPDAGRGGYALHPAWPNPFNPSTTLAFTVPEAATVRLTVHDVAGRLVRTLAAGEAVAAGRHERVWDGRDESGHAAAAGVYLGRLEAGTFRSSVRLALVK
ncbi:MAG: family 16 glycosylhydrolase [Candidatus Krumholzibacteriia bacterium]